VYFGGHLSDCTHPQNRTILKFPNRQIKIYATLVVFILEANIGIRLRKGVAKFSGCDEVMLRFSTAV
jgi:hypothetical protein